LDGPLTFCGITVFGTFDAGIGWASHGAPVNSNLYFGNVAVSKANRDAYFGIVPSGLSQTTLGIKGEEELMPGLAGIFYASTGINPQSGQLANAPGSLRDNNGLPLGAQSLNADGTRGGQAFNDQLYVGLSSKTFGELTFGREKSLSNEVMVGKYDPAGGSYNYSLIGLSGTPVAGGGFTDDGRIDDTMKYKISFPLLGTGIGAHIGAMYKFASGSAGYLTPAMAGTTSGLQNPFCGGPYNGNSCTADNWAWQLDGGFSWNNFNVDVVGGHFNQAVTYGALGTKPILGLPTNIGLNGLAGTAANTSDIMVGVNYTWNQFKLFAGWAQDQLSNPGAPIGLGANGGQGSYTVLSPSNTGFPNTKVLNTIWGGVKYAYNSKTTITLAYYNESQNTYDTAANVAKGVCWTTAQSLRGGKCAGVENFISGYVDYHFTKRFDVYGGLTVSTVSGGMASGYTYAGNQTDWAPTAGLRFTF
jgi:predicted porin